MTFKSPYFLLVLIPLVFILIYIWLLMKRGRYAPKISAPWTKLWKHSVIQNTVPPRFWQILLYSVGLSLLVLALARPQTSFQKTKRSIEGIDIMVVLDLSASMRIEDFREQSRFDVSVKLLQQFVKMRENDRIGFEVFSGEAVTLIPPTLDTGLVLQAIRNVSIGDLKDGTAIGDALATAVGRLKESTAKSRVIVLLTDGDSNVGSIDPLTAGELAKGYDIRVYSIAIGRDGRVAMPFVYKDVFGRQMKTYQWYDSSINPDLLKQISNSTGGKFYRVQENAKVLEDVFKDIDRLEKNKVETTSQIRYDEKFMLFLKAGLLFLFLSFFFEFTLLRVYP
ncbi:MAG: VWA domain-containing protein [Bacteriovoracia bacterium]